MLDESICIDKRLNSVSEGAENLFYRLLSKTDDKANIFADLDLIKGQIYSRRTYITEEAIKTRLLELHNAKNEEEEEIPEDEKDMGLIDIYKIKGGFYAHFPKFFKHQKLRKDIEPKVLYPLHPRNNPLRTCNDPFTQDKLSKDKLRKEVSKEEIENLKKLFNNNPEKIKAHLKARGLGEESIKDVLKKILPNIK